MSEHVNYEGAEQSVDNTPASIRVHDHLMSLSKHLQERQEVLIDEIKIREEELSDVRKALGKCKAGLQHDQSQAVAADTTSRGIGRPY